MFVVNFTSDGIQYNSYPSQCTRLTLGQSDSVYVNMNIYIPSNLVSQLLAGKDSDFFTYSLVNMEIKCQFCVVLLDDYSSSLFDRLCPYTSLYIKIRYWCSKQKSTCGEHKANVVQLIWHFRLI